MPAAKNPGRREAIAERRAEACRLARDGVPWQEIADRLGYASRGAAYTDVMRQLRKTEAELKDLVNDRRAMEDARLDEALAVVKRVMNTRHVVTNGGIVVRDRDTDEPLEDHGPLLAAVDRLIKIGERRARIYGTDAPMKADIDMTSTVEYKIAIDADELEEL